MKTVLVTGANGGIGSALVGRLLKEDGYRVIALTRSKSIADDRVRHDSHDGFIQKSVDLSSHNEMLRLEEYLAQSKLNLDWLVMSHGFIDDETVLENQLPEEIFKTFQLNILSVIYLCRLLVRHINNGGGVITVSSTAALTANGRYAAYSASKAAVNNFMQSLARNRPELLFFSVCAGPTKTPMLEKIGGNLASAQDASVVGELLFRIMGRHTENKSGDIVVIRDGEVSLAGRL
jgi:short-subunit dehydrogenase